MNKRRLLKLADLLEADANNKTGVRFNLGTVVNPGKNLPKDAKTVPVSCGTQACAMGLAAITGAFKRNGLSYRIDARPDETFIETTMYGTDIEYDDAAMELFGISYEEANFLFTPSFYPSRSPKTGSRGELLVAKRIRDFVAGKVQP
jgi:hypothetical protein